MSAQDLKAARAPLQALLRADARNTVALLMLAALDVQEQDPAAVADRRR